MSNVVNSEILLAEYRENRQKIKDMIADLESNMVVIRTLIPKDTSDFRKSKIYLENTLKTITEFYKLIFDMRKEIGKLVKDEIAIITKLGESGDDDNIFGRMKTIDAFLIEMGISLSDLNKIKQNKDKLLSIDKKDEEETDE